MIPPTEDEMMASLELIAYRVPDRHVTPDLAMAAAWLPDFEAFDRGVVLRAARAWAGLRFPTPNEFVEACQAEARRSAARTRALAAGAARPDRPPTRHGSLAWVKAMKEIRALPDDAPDGAVEAIRDKYGLSVEPASFACQRCEDAGVLTSQDGEGQVFSSPCPQCQPEDFDYWSDGHLDADHDVFVCGHPRCKIRAKSGRRRSA